MNPTHVSTPRTPPAVPVGTSSRAGSGGGAAGLWSRGWARAAAMVVGFAVVMVVANSIASSLGQPVVALLVGPLLAAGVLWLYRRATIRVERRPATDLARGGAARGVLIGGAVGFLLAAATTGAIALLGGYQITAWGSLAGALTVIGMMCAIAVAEEVLFRGVIFRLIEQRWGTWLALAVSAALFGLVHLVNPGATLWGAIAVAVEAGLMLGAAYVVTGSLWLPIGLHLGWNVATVAIFGSIASGSTTSGALVTAITPGPVWLTGGAFGLEASVIAVALCSIATTALLITAQRRGRVVGRRR